MAGNVTFMPNSSHKYKHELGVEGEPNYSITEKSIIGSVPYQSFKNIVEFSDFQSPFLGRDYESYPLPSSHLESTVQTEIQHQYDKGVAHGLALGAGIDIVFSAVLGSVVIGALLRRNMRN